MVAHPGHRGALDGVGSPPRPRGVAGMRKLATDPLPLVPERAPRLWPRFAEGRGLHGEAVTARVGSIVGIAFAVCFLTGLWSHIQQHPLSWLPIPASPSWLYRLTQGTHVITGLVLIPLLLIKLHSVFPRLFEWPPAKSLLHALERASIAVLVASALFQLVTGFLNILTWYPWHFGFVQTHYWVSWIVAGSILLHIAVKLPAIRRGLATPLDAPDAAHAPDAALPAEVPPAGPVA